MKKKDDIFNLFENSNNLKTYDSAFFEKKFVKQKDVSNINNNKTGKVYLPSIQKEIEYESNDEKVFLEYLDKSNIAKNIKVQSLTIEYNSLKKIRKYTPDIIVYTKEGHIIICEIKPLNNMTYHLNLKKYKALKEYCLKYGYGYSMIGYNGNFYSLEYLKKRKISKKLENHVNYFMRKDKCYTHNLYKWYKKKNPSMDPLEIHSLILKYKYKKVKMFDTIELRLDKGESYAFKNN